jgi:erythromycin esterase-like protein
MKGCCVTRLLLVLIVLFGAQSGPLRAAEATPTLSAKALAPVIREMCSKNIVFLGEDANHAGAQTIAAKAQLVEILVQRCGFRGVVFESQFYDVLDFQHSLDIGTATESQLSSAIGALWSRYAVFEPFETWLFKEASARRVLVAGVDPQVGGIGSRYSPEELPKAFSAVLDGGDRSRCLEAITRHNQWTYDDAHTFDDAAFDTLEACLRKVTTAAALHSDAASSRLSAMASSYLAYLHSVDPHGADESARDRAMYENLRWIVSQWPAGTRLVVWTASVHASKKPTDGTGHAALPFGAYVHRTMGDQVYALGFSALGGTYGTIGGHGAIHDLIAPPAGSLETVAFARRDHQDDVSFLSGTALKRLGDVPGRAFVYSKFQSLPWSDYLDGVLVFRAETAAKASP